MTSDETSTDSNRRLLNESAPLFDKSGLESLEPKVPPTNYWCLFLAIPMFAGFSALLKFQSHLRTHLFIGIKKAANSTTHNISYPYEMFVKPTDDPNGVSDAGSTAAYIFGMCVSSYYVGLLVFRVGHNVLLGWKLHLSPRGRVMFAYCTMAVAMLMLSFVYYLLFPRIGWTDTKEAVSSHAYCLVGVSICYFIGGVALSTFEPNMLSSLTPLGHKNKALAVVGIPIGTNTMTTFVLLLLAYYSGKRNVVDAIEGLFYVIVAGVCGLGALVYWFLVPYIPFEASQEASLAGFLTALKEYRQWAPQMKYALAAVSIESVGYAISIAIGQYIFDDPVPLLYPFVGRGGEHQVTISKDYYLALFVLFSLFGAVIARGLTYIMKKQYNPMWYLIIALSGFGLILSEVPLLGLLGVFLALYGHGAVYSTAVKRVDLVVPPNYNLVALSTTLSLSDIAGFIGANLVVPLNSLIGTV